MIKIFDPIAGRTRIFERCKRHMLEVVDACDVLDEPFPHFMLQGILPDDIYETALDLLPTRTQYTTFNYAPNSSDDCPSRWRFDMSDQAIATLVPAAQGFWLGLRDALGCVELKRSIFRKFSAALAYRFSVSEHEAVDLPGYPLPALFREEQGYSISPHPDTRKKVVTFQIALPENDSQAHLGTQLYRLSLNPASLTRKPRGFEIVKAAPFVPNSAFAFVVLNTLRRRSWHGRTALTAADGVRNTILNIWYAKPQKGHSDLTQPPEQLRRAA